MMTFFKNKVGIFFLLIVFIVCASLIIPDANLLDEALDNQKELRVSKVLSILGSEDAVPYPNTKEFGVSVKRGEALIKEGFSTRPGGGKTRTQSKHFVCTSCHNLEKEDPDLRFSDPQARLEYTDAKGLPFLQGTTLYGAVNRTSFYNDDYELKYGDLVLPARKDLRKAIQLCAVECAQGRKLKSWEIESILAFLWTIDLKVSDLVLNDEELSFIYSALEDGIEQDSAIALIKSRYSTGSSATFETAQASRMNSEQHIGDPDNGQKIYENSCLHCHEDRKYSYLDLDHDKMTYKHLSRKAQGYGNHSLYQVTRYGVYSRSGRRSYMPQYPLEKLSDKQLEDLRAYIDMKASE